MGHSWRAAGDISPQGAAIDPILSQVRATGEAILDLQYGHKVGLPLSRPMPVVALGVHELRVRDVMGIYRAFYVLKTAQGVLVFHAFQKKTQKTPQREIDLGAKRLKEMLYG